MDRGNEIVIYHPEEGERVEHYFQRLPDSELQNIIANPDLLNGLCSTLIEGFGDIERLEDALENLWSIIEHMDNIDYILSLIRRMETVRQNLLDSLTRSEEEIQKIHKFTSLGRLLGSVVDIAGTAGGLLVRDSNPGIANWSFKVATMFGVLGVVSTLSELDVLIRTLQDLTKQIDDDKEAIAPIRLWSQQTNELELAMQSIFPFHDTSHIVEVFTDASDTATIPVRLLAALIKTAAEQDISHLRDERCIRNLINFCLHPESRDLCLWIVFRRHPIVLDVGKIILQLLSGSPLRFAFCQSIPALRIAEQNISSFPVWGRITLNFVSIFDTIMCLRGTQIPAIVNDMRKLYKYLRAELVALQSIAKFVALRRKRRRRRMP